MFTEDALYDSYTAPITLLPLHCSHYTAPSSIGRLYLIFRVQGSLWLIFSEYLEYSTATMLSLAMRHVTL